MATGKINMGRVILGGLLAGVVINASEAVLNLLVVPQQMEDMLKARNLPAVDSSVIMVFVLLGFLLGIVTVWLYAAIRPRFGPGMGAAIMAGLAVFFLAYVYTVAGMMAMGFFSSGLALIMLLWGLVEILLASIAGAWAYKE